MAGCKAGSVSLTCGLAGRDLQDPWLCGWTGTNEPRQSRDASFMAVGGLHPLSFFPFSLQHLCSEYVTPSPSAQDAKGQVGPQSGASPSEEQAAPCMCELRCPGARSLYREDKGLQPGPSPKCSGKNSASTW